jgi:hypothetical protein
MYSFLYHLKLLLQPSLFFQILLDLTDKFGVMALELFIQGHVRQELD